eukprot:8114688-Lingulodinium_polyedra.AAC.1
MSGFPRSHTYFHLCKSNSAQFAGANAPSGGSNPRVHCHSCAGKGLTVEAQGVQPIPMATDWPPTGSLAKA